MTGKRGIEVDNFATSFVKCQGQAAYQILNLKFDTSRLRGKTAIEFRNMITTWDWKKDRELFWLAELNPDDEKFIPPSESILSPILPVRIVLLFRALSKLFPGLNAEVHLRYGPSEALWDRGFQNHGGYLTITLSKGKVTGDDLPII